MPRSLPSALGVPTWPRLRLSRRLIRYSSVKCPGPWWSGQRDAAAFEAEHSQNLGAHHYIDSQAEDPAAALQALGGASVILTTAASGKAMSPLIGGLRARG